MPRAVPRCPGGQPGFGRPNHNDDDALRRGSFLADLPLPNRTRPPGRAGASGGTPTMLQMISTAFHRGGWGMWPILVTSIVTIAVIVERALYLFKASVDK